MIRHNVGAGLVVDVNKAQSTFVADTDMVTLISLWPFGERNPGDLVLWSIGEETAR